MTPQEQIEQLEQKIMACDNFMEKMELKDELIELKRKLNLIKPPDQDIECFGCGS